ncbi:hypothetical protein C9374_002636 [Naegleria lovaniensis]|uniref:VWFA domain-containing protein n=1 Tax=Naegleria lovaniensis TaxID=51637 RepID=A0AA88GSR8_NAELO|nr:uncharacterized protein C9374_002636 [Naegleria lovaniensis]KAG2386190.1 hypothetical protein C9374_002636 [Naegleria lovaniensis]
MKVIALPKVLIAVVLLSILALTCMPSAAHARMPLLHKRDIRRVLREVFQELSNEFASTTTTTLSDVDMSATTSNNEIPCPPAMFRADKDVDSFLTTLQSQKCLDEKLVALETFIAASALPFSSQQALKIIAVFNKFDFVRKHVTQTLLLRVVELQSSEAISLIKSITENGAERLKILDTIKSNIKDLQANKATVVSSLFTEESLKTQANTMLNNVKPFDCVFGSVSGDRLVFTLDISPSMTIKVSKDSQVTRLDFAKQHLIQTLQTLRPEQQFEIVYFCEKSTQVFGAFVPASTEKINYAIKHLQSVKDCGSTNIEAGMKSSFQLIKSAVTGTNSVYLLSDGIPTAGVTDVKQLVSMVKQWSEQSNVKVNTISLSLGNGVGNLFESDADKESAAHVMSQIAFVTGGTYKRLQSN